MSNLVMLDLNDTLIGSCREDGFVTTMEEWFVLDGAVEAVKSLQEAGFKTAVVTNQSAAHRFEEVTHEQMSVLLEAQRDYWREQLPEVLPFYICWHDKQHQCLCRKPGTLLLLQAMFEADAAPRRDQVWMVGDKESDMEAGMAVGARSILVVWGAGNTRLFVNDITEAARRILQGAVPCE